MKKPPPSRKQNSSLVPLVGANPLADVSLDRENAPRMIHCVICGSDTGADSSEQMCWVCRRLKISAWRDVEQQMPAQE